MKLLIIPSAKIIDIGLQNKFGKIPPVLIPVGKATILDEMYENYKDIYDKIIIVGKEKISLIKEYIDMKKYNIELIEIDKLKDIGYSIYSVLKENMDIEQIDEITVNFGDTLAEYKITELDDVVYYDEVYESERWTIFEQKDDNLIIYDKLDLESDIFNAFIGVFKFSNSKLLLDLLNKYQKDSYSFDSFYYTIKEYNRVNKFHIKKVDKWLDLGHEDNYNNSKKDVQARYFNTINIDRKKGIIRKSSKDVEKFRNEILWYLKLPNTIQYLSPRIFDYSIDYNNMYVNMEYYGYSTIHELFMYGKLSKTQWRQVFKSIFLAIEDMRNFIQEVDNNSLIHTLKEMYYVKTIERMEQLRDDINFKEFFYNNVIINGIKYKNLNYYMDNLQSILEKNNIYTLDKLSIIHGDLCFANIIYDLNSQIIRLIDPRGKFGEYDIYGDYRYDLAKISHSVNGKYDYIINDLFNIDINKNQITYEMKSSENSELSRKIFYEFLSKDILDQVELIESILFFSMIPLHKDYPKRQLAMMCTGIQLIDRFIIEEV